MKDFPIDPNDTDQLREGWRLLAREWSRLEDAAARLEEGRGIVLSEETLARMMKGLSKAQAELEAKVCDRFRHYVRTMHDARRAANDAKIEMQNADRLYWSRNNAEAQMRAEMRMTR